MMNWIILIAAMVVVHVLKVKKKPLQNEMKKKHRKKKNK